MQTKNTWFIGDPCYVVTESDRWLDFVKVATDNNNNTDKHTVYSTHDSKFATTEYGDGEYECSFGYSYSVDSGLIGFTPQHMWSQNIDQSELNKLGLIVTGDSIELYVLIAGVLQFVVINDKLKEYYTINTRLDNDEKEEDSWDESYDDEDNSEW